MSKQMCLSLTLKPSKVLDCFMVLGKELHNVGPATENDLAANVLLLVHGTIKNLRSLLDLRPSLCMPLSCIISLR